MLTLNTDNTHTCLLCDNHTHDRICSDHNEDVPTCPCGNELTGLGSYCSSHCAEVYGRRARARVEMTELEPSVAAAVMADADVVEATDDDVPILLPPTSTVTPAKKLKALLDKDAIEAAKSAKPKKSRRSVCTFCTNSTKGVCRCKRPLCGPCADEETGLCPHCADDVV